ncbi:MAG TPA: S41 family peptidase [Saprospiraceae bacterium]|nr:S41 family peptidase [Saprospiraceae bacterium]
MKNYIIPAFLLLLLTASCEKTFVDAPDNNPEAVFENLWQTFHEEYAPFEERKVDWPALYAQYRPLVGPETTEDSLYQVVTRMLAALDDGHVNLTTPNREVFNANRIRREKADDNLFSLPVIKNYLEPGYKTDDKHSYLYGKIKGQNVGYIYFDYVAENFFQLETFLREQEQANGLIIDLRHNQGGDFTYCFSEIGRLTDQRRFVFRSKTKNGKAANDYTDWTAWHITPKGNYIDKPIVVLTDRYTISAGERAVMAFSVLPNVTLMGDTTCGAHGTMIGRELANGWYYSLVPQKVELPDGKSYEGIGLPPDIYIKNQSADMSQGIDQTLEMAVERLK